MNTEVCCTAVYIIWDDLFRCFNTVANEYLVHVLLPAQSPVLSVLAYISKENGSERNVVT